MGEHEQRLLLVRDRERERWRHGLVGQHGDRCADNRDQVIGILALEISIEAGSLDGNVVEMKRVVAATFETVRCIGAVVPVSTGVVDDPCPLLLRSEGSAGNFELQMVGVHFVVERAIVVTDDALHAIGPGTCGSQIEAKDLPNLLFGARFQQLVGDRADHLVTLVTPGRHGGRAKDTERTGEREHRFRHRLSDRS
jgi:hypothetical protein